jgi:hypothetical protein
MVLGRVFPGSLRNVATHGCPNTTSTRNYEYENSCAHSKCWNLHNIRSSLVLYLSINNTSTRAAHEDDP